MRMHALAIHPPRAARARLVTTVTPPRHAAEEVRIDKDSKSPRPVNASARPEAVLTAVCIIGAQRKHDASPFRARDWSREPRPSRTIRAVHNARHPSSLRIRSVQLASVALAFAAAGASAPAGVFSGVDARPQSTAPAESGDLAPTPLEADLLNFSMRVPSGTSVRIERGPSPSYLLAEASDNPRWRMRAASLRASRLGTTAQSQCQDFLGELKAKGQQFTVLLDEPRTIAGRQAHLFYIAVPIDGGGSGISGTLMVPTGPDQYLVFSLVALEEGFERTRALLDKSFATLTLVEKSAVLDERATLLGRGEAIVASITPEALRATITKDPLFYRMWKPDEKGAPQEVGYVIIRVREGKRGEVDASKAPDSLKGEEAEAGLLALVDARVIVNNDATNTLDVQSRYFLMWDRSSESWSMRSTQRQRANSRSSAQTGVRTAPTTGAPRPTIKVISASRDGMTRDPIEWPVPPAYVSQAELVVLGQLMPRKEKIESIDFLNYAFDQRDQKLPQRRETWSRTATGWKLETRIGSSPDVLIQEFDKDGVRVRRIDPDGTVTERIALEELRKLWNAKGLPVG